MVGARVAETSGFMWIINVMLIFQRIHYAGSNVAHDYFYVCRLSYYKLVGSGRMIRCSCCLTRVDLSGGASLGTSMTLKSPPLKLLVIQILASVLLYIWRSGRSSATVNSWHWNELCAVHNRVLIRTTAKHFQKKCSVVFSSHWSHGLISYKNMATSCCWIISFLCCSTNTLWLPYNNGFNYSNQS